MCHRQVQIFFSACRHPSQRGSRTSSYQMSRKWGVYYVVGLVLKSYLRVSQYIVLRLQCANNCPKVRHISLSKNILRALEANRDIPPLHEYPRAHQVRSQSRPPRQDLTRNQVTYRYYLGMLSFLNEDYTKVRCAIYDHDAC